MLYRIEKMKKLSNNIYCGPPGLGLGQILGFGGVKDFSEWFGKGKIYFVHRARTGIQYTCKLLGLKDGDEVLAPAYNCGSEIDAVLHSGSKVILYRIDRGCNIDLADLRARITSNTRAIYVIHYFGFSQPMDEVRQLCSERGLYLIEDCALALFSFDGRQRIGQNGDYAVFSLPKTLPVPDGGVLVINNPTLCSALWRLTPPNPLRVVKRMLPLAKASILRGFSSMPGIRQAVWFFFELLRRAYRPVARRSGGQRPNMPAGYYYDDETITDISLSVLTAKMMASFQIDDVRARRRTNYSLYLSGICDLESIRPLFPELSDGVCPLNFPVMVANRSALCAALNQRGIAAIEWWSGYHRGLAWEQHPDACFLKDHVLALPVHQGLDEKDITYIVNTLAELI
jgi:perosamine synthetase